MPRLRMWGDNDPAETAESYIDLIIDHCDRYKLQLTLVLSRLMGAQGLVWFHNLMHLMQLTPEHIRTEFLKRFANQVRPLAVTNLERLVRGQVRQGADTIETFSDRFTSIV
jgi:hypothetical protein